jgi:CRISPR-associated endonuclease/helicase Cas3
VNLDEPWAKTNTQGELRSVVAHCLDVALMTRALLDRATLRRRLGAAFGAPLQAAHLDRLAVLAGLHDLGKALKGFQDKLQGPTPLGSGHVAEALAVLMASPKVQQAVGVEELRTWFDAVTDALYIAICHHGMPVPDDAIARHLASATALLEPTIFGHEPVQEIRRLAEALRRAFSGARGEAPPLRFTPAAQHLFAGVLMAADWMASGFAFDDGERDALALQVLDQTAWDGWHSGALALDLLGEITPRPAQSLLADLDVKEKLAVLEAPTGTGKTEAALIWGCRLAEHGKVDGLYFAVPSRSAATEIHARIGKLMVPCHPRLTGKIVRALPGMLDTDRERPDYPPETWAVVAPKRVFAAPVAVGTIDQALLSVLRTKHAWMRAAFLSRHLLVIDEVHASDPYMASLTNVLVDRHLALGGYVLAMSATLGETALALLQRRRRRAPQAALGAPYPAVRLNDRDMPLGAPPERTVSINLRTHEALIADASAMAAAGQAILWIRSTVTDAVADFRTFESAGVSCGLHHSRYALEDRCWLDDRLLGLLGPRGVRRGCVVVATQTAEQSLDIDADVLVTDTCPADVLLQRLGRLHRHRTGTRPDAYVIDPGNLDQYLSADGNVRGRPGQGWPFVYGNLLSVMGTLDWIAETGEISVPRDSRKLVEQATHADHLKTVAEARGGVWRVLWRRLFEADAQRSQLGEASTIDWRRPYRENPVGEFLPTRLAAGTVTVAMQGLVSPFTGEPLDAIAVPARWLAASKVAPDTRGVAQATVVGVGALAMTYDRLGLQRR